MSSNESTHDYPDGERTVQLREEELQPRKESVETGRVRVDKDVVEEQQTLDVPVTREEVTIERRPVDRQVADVGIGEDSETIRVPVREDQVSVDKRAVVTEEINVGRRQVQETQQVSGTVRREEARIEPEGDVDLKQDR
jgi:uncharacterized protein (TIGR02271 family)